MPCIFAVFEIQVKIGQLILSPLLIGLRFSRSPDIFREGRP